MLEQDFYPNRVDKVYPGLFISGAIFNYSALLDNNITHVVNLRAEHHDDISILTRYGISYYWLPIGDWGSPRSDQINTLLQLWDSLDPSDNMLIHCAVGIGRAPCMALAILQWEGLEVEQSIINLIESRPEIRMLPTQTKKVNEVMGKICQ